MTRDIRLLSQDDLPELSRFLTTGFHAPGDADFAAPEVLRWKYLQPQGSIPAPCSFLARDEAGRIIGHLGLCRTVFEGLQIAAPGGRVETAHIIDWLGSPDHRAVGLSLMRRAHEGIPTLFGLGATDVAHKVAERAGYELIRLIPAYTRTLRASYWLRTGGLSLAKRVARLAGEAGQRSVHRPTEPRRGVALRRVSSFAAEIDRVVEAARSRMIVTRRDAARLNHLLRFPRQAMSGWHVLDETNRLCGFALLNLISHDGGRTCTGKIVDCLLDDVGATLWQSAFRALTKELSHQGADIALAYGSTPWTADALSRCGFVSRYGVKFHIRDRHGLLPRGGTYHLTPLEGDFAYT